MECYDVDFYHKENGDCPVDDFLESLDTKMRAKVLGAVALLEANGPQLREPYSKFIGDGIFEIVLSRAAISHVFCISFTLESVLF